MSVAAGTAAVPVDNSRALTRPQDLAWERCDRYLRQPVYLVHVRFGRVHDDDEHKEGIQRRRRQWVHGQSKRTLRIGRESSSGL